VALKELRQGLPSVPVVVELADDNAERAFTLLKLGAFDVRSGRISRVEKLCESLRGARGRGKPPYQPLMLPDPDADGHWAFMSITFEARDENTNAYDFAICPAFRALGLCPTKALQRADDIVPNDGRLQLRPRVHQAIERRKVVVVALLSPPDDELPPNPNCMYDQTLEGFEMEAKRRYLSHLLDRYDGDLQKVADRADLHITNLRKWLHKLGVPATRPRG
jgi:hypothetical protein